MSLLLSVLQIAFNLYIFVLVVRLITQSMSSNYYNPVTLHVFRITQPLVRPLQRYIPGYKGIDGAIIVLILAIQLIKITLISLIEASGAPNILGILMWAFADILSLGFTFYFYAILIYVILSWLGDPQNPTMGMLGMITEPLLKPARRIIPPIAGFDLSPIAVILLLELTRSLLVIPWLTYGHWLAIVG